MGDDDVPRAQLLFEEATCTLVLFVYPGLVIGDLSEVVQVTLVARRLFTRCEPQRGAKKALSGQLDDIAVEPVHITHARTGFTSQIDDLTPRAAVELMVTMHVENVRVTISEELERWPDAFCHCDVPREHQHIYFGRCAGGCERGATVVVELEV